MGGKEEEETKMMRCHAGPVPHLPMVWSHTHPMAWCHTHLMAKCHTHHMAWCHTHLMAKCHAHPVAKSLAPHLVPSACTADSESHRRATPHVRVEALGKERDDKIGRASWRERV